jgi:protein arginine kinase activator
MLCQLCGKNEAVIHFTEIAEGEIRHLHICGECAKQKELVSAGEVGVPKRTASSKPLLQLLQKLLASDSEDIALKCAQCGHTYADFRSTGRLGCGNCYDAFAAKLEGMLKRMHGSDRHRGKVPECMDEKVRLHRARGRLKRELEKAIAGEAFEEAAKIRDEIKTLEDEMAGSKGNADGAS